MRTDHHLDIENEVDKLNSATIRPWKLWYKNPSARWEQALPVGNGRLGGMVFGGVKEEVIQWNEDTLWSGFPRDTNNYDALRYLERVRELIAAGRYAEAEQIIEAKMLGRRTESFLPFGDLHVKHHGISDDLSGYRRELNLDTGIASVIYKSNDCSYSREVFVSAADQVAVLQYRCQGEGMLNLTASLKSPLKHETRKMDTGRIALFGRAPTHIADNYMGDHPQSILYEEGLGQTFEMQLMVQADGGTVTAENGEIRVIGASSVTFLLSAATDFEGFDVMPGSKGKDPTQRCEEILLCAAKLRLEELRTRHIEDHQKLFRRVDLDLGQKSSSEHLPTDERLDAYRAGGSDPGLEALMFQYGRYLLMASSRPGTQPAHLQGIWNPHVQPPWNSDYTTNINTEMNYWPAEVTNLSECHEPLIQMIGELSIHGSRTAAVHYGCRGWTAHHNVDLWRMSTPSDGSASWAFWPMGGVWLCRHLWEHYLYNPDLHYLRETAYPLIKGAALFALDWLVQDDNGDLVTSPSTSPENKFLTPEGIPCSVSAGSTMDMALIRDLFCNCVEASSLLDQDTELRKELEEALSRLGPYRIDEQGRLMEWMEPLTEAEPGHRHVSHLFGLYPGNDINLRDTPLWAEAAERSLSSRIHNGGGHTGWSCVWLINLYARLQKPEAAYEYIRILLARSSHDNLLGDHPPFQIDANFGGAAGLAEMLLQSHLDGIELLPALPKAWETGSVRGLKARGGFIVDMEWRQGRLTQARIHSIYGKPCRIISDEPVKVSLADGTDVPMGNGFSFRTVALETYFIKP